ncbi:hypothetical protein [Streptomyces litchfieldiae]|uniref:SRPBCC family protein n=1 Tax=Streptomyces litchfieldiae TaxID=3075543 RepID=A0ABU2N0Y0_9ACTN|nr:hypothetical protein [Streptomyces sp. DSM 44938]MDT0347247.1 hypothetical protein [Streptomyces sp. DSM 44938]
MARLRHTITLTSVARADLDRFVGVAREVLEGLHAENGALVAEDGRRVVDVDLRSGEHLEPGARYGVTSLDGQSVEAELLSWDRERETGLRIDVTEPAHVFPDTGRTASARMTFALWLRGAAPLERVELKVNGALTRPDGRRRRLRWFALTGELDVVRWFAAAEGAAGRPALTLRIRHPILRAAVTAAPRPGPEGTWRLEVVTTVRGRGLARPVAAVPLLVTRRMLHKGLGQALARVADDWHTDAVPELTRTPEDVRHRLLDDLCTPRPEKS